VDIVLSLEASVQADRLSPVFLHGRNTWIERLHNIHTHTTSLSTAVTAYNMPPSAVVNEFDLVKQEVTYLVNNIRPLAAITLVSRQVFTILLTQRIPQEVCWFIFEFVTDSTKMRMLLNEYKGLSSNQGYEAINLRSWRPSYDSITRCGYQLACSFIYEKKAQINAMDTHYPDIYIADEPSRSDEEEQRTMLRASNTVEILHEAERPTSSFVEEDALLEREILNKVIQRSLEEM